MESLDFTFADDTDPAPSVRIDVLVADQYGSVYCGPRDAARVLNLRPDRVVRVLRGERFATKGYRFTFL
jgi:hypothetical protein